MSSGIVLGFAVSSGGFGAAAGAGGAGTGTCTTTRSGSSGDFAVITFQASTPMPPANTTSRPITAIDPLRRAAALRLQQDRLLRRERAERRQIVDRAAAARALSDEARPMPVLAAIARMSISPEPSVVGAVVDSEAAGFALGTASDCRFDSENSTEFS